MSEDFGFGSGVTHSDNTEETAKKERVVPIVPKGPGKGTVKAQKRYDIRVDSQVGEPRDIKVGVNGKVYQIWRGVIVSVPEEVVEVFRNAIAAQLVYIPQPDGTTREEWQDRSSVPFSILRGPY
jgi:hypothetical protein